MEVSEDCLFLNIWAPPNAKKGDNLAVMVWIFGGAFLFGDGSLEYYDGSNIAH